MSSRAVLDRAEVLSEMSEAVLDAPVISVTECGDGGTRLGVQTEKQSEHEECGVVVPLLKHTDGPTMAHLPHAIEDGDAEDDDDDAAAYLQDGGVQQRRRSSKRLNSSNQMMDDASKIRSKMSVEFSMLKSQLREGKMQSKQLALQMLTFDSFDINRFQLLNQSSLPSGVRIISQEDFVDLVRSYYATDLPQVDIMFPWLHGLNPNNFGQINFFLNKQQDLNKPRIITFDSTTIPAIDSTLFDPPENAKFLMPVRSCDVSGNIEGAPGTDFYSNSIYETTGFIKGSVLPQSILLPLNDYEDFQMYILETIPPQILNLVSLDQLWKDIIELKLLPEFINLDPISGINLRNFSSQVNKISNISHFFVYCFSNYHSSNNCKCLPLSRLLNLAQLNASYKHSSKSAQFNTLIISNLNESKLIDSKLMSIENLSIDCSMKKNLELCSEYDVHVFNNWDSNYLYKERLEISKMSSATPLNNNIWLGNITDYECLKMKLKSNHSINQIDDSQIEIIHDEGRRFPNYTNFNKSSIVKLTKENFLNKTHEEIDNLLINSPQTKWKILIYCNEQSRIPSLEEIEQLFSKKMDENDLLEINFPVSGSLSAVDLSIDNILSIINLLKFLYYSCNSKLPCLIYCSDGYTESSLLTLFLIIYSFGISVDEAILKLHKEFGRPFFLFKSDYGLLVKLESILIQYSPINHSNKDFENDKIIIRQAMLKPNNRSRNNSVGSTGNANNGGSFITPTGHHVVQLRGSGTFGGGGSGLIGKFGAPPPPSLQRRPSFPDTPMLPLEQIDISGSLIEIDGSLPSLILPHLYLGSIDHAMCIPMITRLGIEYIISVGESIEWVNKIKYDKFVTNSGCEIYQISPGQKLLNSSYEIKVKKVIKLPNINDDGIGSLSSTLDDVIKFIDEVYQSSGKVLCHCQVGVSRSATVCIAEVMNRLNISVARAYMFVRVRRLNVIIQPNLKLMYELFKWEERNRKKKCREVDWHILCREIFTLNKTYIR